MSEQLGIVYSKALVQSVREEFDNRDAHDSSSSGDTVIFENIFTLGRNREPQLFTWFDVADSLAFAPPGSSKNKGLASSITLRRPTACFTKHSNVSPRPTC